MLKVIALVAASVAGVQLMNANVETSKPSADYTQEVNAWRAQRLERLKAPDGWLSLVGLHWLKEGKNSIGSAKTNDIVLAKAPEQLGTVILKGRQASVELAAKSNATIDGKKVKSAPMVDDSHEKPTTIAFGTTEFYLIERNGKFGLRVKDSAAEARTGFRGIDQFAIDPSWRIEAKWVPFDPPHKLETPNVLGETDQYPVPGKAVFTRDGKTYELMPVLEEPGAKQLFLIFADRTSGKQTYGAGRFLYADMPRDGKIVLDFNKAYNPPCAFTSFATCPLAPPENRLDAMVTAGEKKYAGAH